MGAELSIFASEFVSDSQESSGSPLWSLAGARPPRGRRVSLSDGRSLFMREVESDVGSPPILLLHGWLASAGLNWLRAFEPLGTHHRVLAPDLHGHARAGLGLDPAAESSTKSDSNAGSRSEGEPAFTIERCADDMAALLAKECPDQPAIVVGYSLGGMVAQELWHRHRQCVAGLVLGATSSAPVPIWRGRHPLAHLANLARFTTHLAGRATRAPRRLGRSLVGALPNRLQRGLLDRPLGHWATREFARHHWPTVLDAGRAIAHFDARDWVGSIDVPTSVLLTARDRLIPPEQQREMAQAIEHAHVETMDAGHLACVRRDFAERLEASCRAVEQELA